MALRIVKETDKGLVIRGKIGTCAKRRNRKDNESRAKAGEGCHIEEQHSTSTICP